MLEKLTLLLGPFAPYLAEEMWEQAGRQGPVFKQSWPEFDEELARDEGAEVVLQVNGKVRSRATVPFGTAREELERIAVMHARELPLTIRALLYTVGGLRSSGANLLTYLLFERSYCRALIRLGYKDTMARKDDLVAFLGY